MEEKPGGGLRNTIYEQQTRSGRRLTPGRLLLYKLLVPMALSLVRLVWSWSRVHRVIGAEHIASSLAGAPSFIPVYWHQHQLFCVKLLLEQRAAGLRLGFLISPSVDGEIGAMLVRSLGGEVIRGSSSHTGARALRDYYQALARDGVSPAITPDGPRGPPWKFKPGAVLLIGAADDPVELRRGACLEDQVGSLRHSDAAVEDRDCGRRTGVRTQGTGRAGARTAATRDGTAVAYAV